MPPEKRAEIDIIPIKQAGNESITHVFYLQIRIVFDLYILELRVGFLFHSPFSDPHYIIILLFERKWKQMKQTSKVSGKFQRVINFACVRA